MRKVKRNKWLSWEKIRLKNALIRLCVETRSKKDSWGMEENTRRKWDCCRGARIHLYDQTLRRGLWITCSFIVPSTVHLRGTHSARLVERCLTEARYPPPCDDCCEVLTKDKWMHWESAYLTFFLLFWTGYRGTRKEQHSNQKQLQSGFCGRSAHPLKLLGPGTVYMWA
jgi:hypothetical protein